MVVHAGGRGSQQNKQEPDRHRDLQDRLQLYRLLQPHKCHGGLLQEVHAAWKPKKMMVNTQAVLNHERWRHKCSVARFTTFSNPPTRTTVASAFSGIFSSSFSSCLDLDRCIPEDKDGSFCKRHRRKLGQWEILKYKRDRFVCQVILTCISFFSISMCVSASPAEWIVPMRGSVTDGSCWWMWLALLWCVIRLPRLAAEMFLGKGLLCSFSSLGWLREAARGRERLSRRKRGRDQAWSQLVAESVWQWRSLTAVYPRENRH